MSTQKNSNFLKYCIFTSTTALVLIFISLLPISMKSLYWNQCLKKTYQWLYKFEDGLKDWDKASKESIAVAVCNGAVYEPTLKAN